MEYKSVCKTNFVKKHKENERNSLYILIVLNIYICGLAVQWSNIFKWTCSTMYS